jgi:hypothetical protein
MKVDYARTISTGNARNARMPTIFLASVVCGVSTVVRYKYRYHRFYRTYCTKKMKPDWLTTPSLEEWVVWLDENWRTGLTPPTRTVSFEYIFALSILQAPATYRYWTDWYIIQVPGTVASFRGSLFWKFWKYCRIILTVRTLYPSRGSTSRTPAFEFFY